MNAIGGRSHDANVPTQEQTDHPPAPPATVASEFSPLHLMVMPNSQNNWLNDKNQGYMRGLGDLSSAIQSLPAQVHNDIQLETQQLQQARNALSAAETALHTLEANFPNTATGTDIDLRNLLREPLERAKSIVAAVVIIPTSSSAAHPTGPAPPPEPDPALQRAVKASIKRVNESALELCSGLAELQGKFPFDSNSTTDISISELNQLLQPGTGKYSLFSNLPDVSRTYNHTGRIWAAKPDFPALFSQQFVATLNGISETADELYGATGTTPHLDLTITVDGTGKIPFSLEVDGHNVD